MNQAAIKRIVEDAGGMIELSYELGLTNFAVRSWYARGIPRRYWKLLANKTGKSIQDIERASNKARSDKKAKKL